VAFIISAILLFPNFLINGLKKTVDLVVVGFLGSSNMLFINH